MIKRNNVQAFKFDEKLKEFFLWLSAEDGKMFCSYCKEFDTLQAETNSSQAVGVTAENFDREPAIELWWNDA